MKKILYIVSNPFSYSRNPVGGNISSASGVISGFMQHGYHVDILTDTAVPTLDYSDDSLKIIFYPYRKIRLLVPSYRKGLIGKIFKKIDDWMFRFSMKIKVDSLAKNFDYELCYMRASYHGSGAANVLRKRNLDLVLEVNKPISMGPFNNKDMLEWPKKGQFVKVPFLERNQYEAAKLITVDSSLRANWVTEFVDQNLRKKMIVNYNGVNTKMFAPSIPKSQNLEGFISSNDDILVGMASSFRWYNDIEEMCKIFSRASSEFNKLKYLIVIGDKSKEKELLLKIRDYNLQNSTKVLCQVPFYEMPSLLNCCDILISHFNFHGKWPHNCSIKHLEYLALGKPTVATNVGEVNFAIEQNLNGILCGEGNEEQFAKSIVHLAKNPDLRKKFGIAGREKALQQLDWRVNVENILDSLK